MISAVHAGLKKLQAPGRFERCEIRLVSYGLIFEFYITLPDGRKAASAATVTDQEMRQSRASASVFIDAAIKSLQLLAEREESK